jgi:hypothetical protein
VGTDFRRSPTHPSFVFSPVPVSKAQALEGRFPDVAAVLPTTPPLLMVRVNAELLAGLCAVAVALQPREVCPSVVLLLYAPDRPIGLMAQGEGGLTLDALLMPLT